MNNHNYTLKEVKISDAEPEATSLEDDVIRLYLKNVKSIPDRIAKRVEIMMNDTISEYEGKNKKDIPIDKFDFEVTFEVDTIKDTFAIGLYLGCVLNNDLIKKTLYLTTEDAEYQFIKDFFFDELNRYVAGQIERIKSHID
jgi:hypothetical protein